MKQITFLFGLFIFLIFAGSCNTQDDAESQPQPTLSPTPDKVSRLNIALGTLPTEIDPHRSSNGFTSTILRYVCQGLITLSDEPLLAESWEIGPDNKSIVFFLKENVVFRDGSPFDAESVLYSLSRLKEPEAQDSPVFEDFQNISIEKIDDFTIQFTFKEKQGDLLSLFGTDQTFIISANSNPETVGRDPVCTGAYFVTDWEDDQFILLSKNEQHTTAPDYFKNRGVAMIDEVKINFIPTHDERIEAFFDGRIDVVDLNTKNDLEAAKGMGSDLRITTAHWLGGISYLGFNGFMTERSLVRELEVRQAIAHAVDKQALINLVLAEEFAQPAVSILSPRLLGSGYSEELKVVEYEFDLAKSEELLVEAGFLDSDGDGILERDGEPLDFLLLTTKDDINLDMAKAIQMSLKEIGVGISIQQSTPAEISEITPTGEFDLLLYGYNWPFPTAIQLFLGTENIGAANRVGYSDPEVVDPLLEEIASLEVGSPDVERLAILAQEKIIQDVAWHPILARRVVRAVNTRVTGEWVHENGDMLWHDANIID